VKTVGDTQLTVEMTLDGSVRTFSSKDGIITESYPADIISPKLTTKDMRLDRTVEANGTINLYLRGWIKANLSESSFRLPDPGKLSAETIDSSDLAVRKCF